MATEYQTLNLDTSEKDKVIFAMLPNDPPLKEFEKIWYQVFLWSLFSSILVHTVAAAVACGRLRKHKIGRFVPMLIIAMGLMSPLTSGAITSAAIAGVYRASGIALEPMYALVYGVGHTLVAILISFTRILATL